MGISSVAVNSRHGGSRQESLNWATSARITESDFAALNDQGHPSTILRKHVKAALAFLISDAREEEGPDGE